MSKHRSECEGNREGVSGAKAPGTFPSILSDAVALARQGEVELSPAEIVRLARVIAEDRKAEALERIAAALEDLP
jgi:hypothetical protein